MRSQRVVLVLASLFTSAPTPVLADVRDVPGWDASIGVAGISGDSPSEDIDGRAVRIGLERRFHRAFGFGPELSYVGFAGERAGLANSVRGVAATYLARWYAHRTERLTVYLQFGFGGVAFSEPFPRGGTRFNGTSLYGGGLALALDGAVLRLDARQMHSSNGQGIVAENPAYDGLELGLQLAVPVDRGDVQRAATLAPNHPTGERIRLVRAELFMGARGDGYSTLDTGGDVFGGLHTAVEARVSERFATQLELLAGMFSNQRQAYAAAARAYYRGDAGALGAFAGYTAIVDQRAGETVGAFVELYEHRTLRTSVAVGHERKHDAPDLQFAEVMLHLYPTERVLLQAGFSYAPTGFKQTRADIVMHAEYAPVTIRGTTLAGYLQWGGNLFTRGSLGLVMYFDRDGYPRRERHRGVHGLRFK